MVALPIFRWEVGLKDQTIRTIGASVVLIGLLVVGIIQVGTAEAPAAAEIVTRSPSDEGAAAPTTASASGAGQTESTPAPDPFVYRLGVLSGVSTENFWAYYGNEPSVWNSYILGPTKPALYSLDATGGGLTPQLLVGDATPTWDADGWRVRVELDPAYRWSDGEPITASDFVFTFETVRKLKLGGSWADAYPRTIESVHADGDHQLRIEFGERPNLAVWPHGVGLAPLMPEHVWRSAVDTNNAKQLYRLPGRQDVSGGPLMIALASERLIISHANPHYPGPIGADSVEYHVYDDEPALVAAVKAGEVDSVLTPKGLTQEQLQTVVDDPGISVLESPANGVRYLGFNLDRQPMAEDAFRRALALLLDREELAEEFSDTGVAWSFVPESNEQWFDEKSVEKNQSRYSGDVESRLDAALKGLRDAGYAWQTDPRMAKDGSLVAGTGLTIGGRAPQPLTILTPGDAYDPTRPDYVREIADTLAVLGFDARPVVTDFDSVVDLAFTAGEDGEMHYDMYLLGWTLGRPDLPAYYRPFFAKEGALNNTGYESDKFDDALERYERAFSFEAARDALWAMERALAADLPYLLLYTSQVTEIYRSDRVGFDVAESLGGLQGRLGGFEDVRPIN